MLRVNTGSGAFFLLGRNIDLTGLTSTVPVSIQVGAYLAEVEYDYIDVSMRFLRGTADIIDVTSISVIPSGAAGGMLMIRGTIALSNEAVSSIGEHEITVRFGDSVEAGFDGSQMYNIANGAIYMYPAHVAGAEATVTNAMFMLQSNSFFMIIRNVQTQGLTGTVRFELEFDGFLLDDDYEL